MNIYSLHDNLDSFRVILVTGPQRSGTTFVAKAFAHDMRRPYVDEAVFGIRNSSLWRHIVEEAKHCIVQCPAMMKEVHDVPDDCLVVVVRRGISGILKSQERIGWGDNKIELEKYGLDEGIAAKVKYKWWDEHKHLGPANWMEIQYRNMMGHTLWVPQDERVDFAPKQTRRINEESHHIQDM